MRESSFTNNPENPRFNPVNRLKDMQNSVGRQFNPDKDEYWDLMREKMGIFTDDELEYLGEQSQVLGEDKEKIERTIGSIIARRAEEKRIKLDKFKKVFEEQTS